MVSAWIAEEALHCTLNMGFFEGQGHHEAEAWGTVLADMVKHLANAFHDEHNTNRSNTIAAVLEALHEELNTPTSDAEGEFHARPS